MKSLVYVYAFLFAFGLLPAAQGAPADGAAGTESVKPFSGIARGKDGDSLAVGGTDVRLFGVDAPEWDQMCTRGGQSWSCGTAAAEQLSRLVTGKQVMCWPTGLDQHGRTLARCIAGGIDINDALVRAGFAVAFRRYSNDYVAAEEAAKSAKRGLWAGTFKTPSDYRRSEELQPSPPRREARKADKKASSSDWAGRARANCTIKGNRNRRGQWIYHVPGMPYYEQTRPEQIFCTEAEALAAGYRRAIVKR